MAVLIFKLRYVPDDEAQDIRELLSENDILFYETTAGILGMSMPGIWLKDDTQADLARKLIDDYQQLRQDRAQDEYSRAPRSFGDLFKENPLRYVMIVLAIAVIAFITVFMFFGLR